MTINEKILQIAEKYLGITEKPGNSGWYDEAFEAKMIARGWLRVEAWCAYFAELDGMRLTRISPYSEGTRQDLLGIGGTDSPELPGGD
jgi:hypothetical protein